MSHGALGVARAGAGAATVAVTLPDSRMRVLFFEGGEAVGTDSSQAARNTELRATKQDDL